ncbi:MAG: hypothetical protein LQ344_004811 [Seirophora lacunosa]|nr:MAG: hypothetical protein LQ344_004811 [Seirophora lacunosa]
MSYYFCIVNTRDQPTFEVEFGTSKQGGDGVARFSQEARNLNPFLMHASLDYVDDLQWHTNQMCVPPCPAPPRPAHSVLSPIELLVYLKRIDHFASSHISAFLTPTSTRFLLLHLPHPPNTDPIPPPQTSTSFSPYGPYTNSFPGTLTTPSLSSSNTSSSRSSIASVSGGNSIANNPTSPQTEEAIRLFFVEVFECWIKSVMSPFGGPTVGVGSPVFRSRVLAAGKKYL